MILIFLVSTLIQIRGLEAITCSAVTTLGNTWNQGQDGRLRFTVPSTSTTWKIIMTFDKPVSTLYAWQGIVQGCTNGGTVCTFINQSYNGRQTQGSTLELGYQIQFAFSSTAPKLISLTFNGVSLCSDGTAPTTTATSTTTTTSTAPPVPGSGPVCDGNFYEYPYQWNTGANGNFFIHFSQSVNSWTIQVTFESPVNSLSVWNGANIACYGTLCSFTNAGYNGVQSGGQILTLGFQISFSSGPAPRVTSIMLNNVMLCTGSGSGVSTTTATTQMSTTPTSTTAAPTTTSTTTSPPVTTSTSSTTVTQTTTTTAGSSTTTPTASGRCSDYNTLLDISLLFYEAQRSGHLPSNQRVTWRKDSALSDKGNNGEDLTGGYYDAGDYVKFGFPMAYTMTVLAWGGIAYPDGYINAGMMQYLREAVKWGTDYFIKAHVAPNVLYGQVGDGYADHSYWGRPEDMTMARPAWAIASSAPGSELAGETSAAMAAASILFKSSDPAYSSTLLTHARQLFTFADTYRGNYAQSISNAAGFYNSWSGYNDELVWAALWLYKATGETNYLTYATNGYSEYGISGINEVFSWDSKFAGVKVLIANLTGQASYVQDVQTLCNVLINQTPKSPLGQAFFSQWGSLRYTANAGFICLLATDLNIPEATKQSYQNFAVDQMEYILAKTGRSFVIGFGSNYPLRPHHRSSSCPLAPTTCDWNNFNSPGPNPQILYGALVGGPSAANDQYTDSRSDYISNEVAMDYNAGFQGLVAGLREKACP